MNDRVTPGPCSLSSSTQAPLGGQRPRRHSQGAPSQRAGRRCVQGCAACERCPEAQGCPRSAAPAAATATAIAAAANDTDAAADVVE